uniref:Uncharacterized protein n=1 Tax=Parascaris univalens TaxID=6257 RepID=A0A915BTQ2_PARUN
MNCFYGIVLTRSRQIGEYFFPFESVFWASQIVLCASLNNFPVNIHTSLSIAYDDDLQKISI